MLIDLHGWSQHARTAIYNYAVFQPLETMLIAICVLMLVVFVLVSRNHRRGQRRKKKVAKPVTRGTTMTKAERTAAVKKRVEDIVTDGLEKAILRKELTPQEAAVYYKRFANAFKCYGLLPKKIEKGSRSLKETIQLRAVKFRNYLYTPVKIPGDSPPAIKKTVWPEKTIERVKGVFAGKRRMA